jgi:uncharacterized sulfatase
MKTRDVILYALACSLIETKVAQATVPQKEKNPNVIFILVDDVAAGWLPPYARQLQITDLETEVMNSYKEKFSNSEVDFVKHLDAAKNSMPFVDKLSNQGMIFNMCFTTAPLSAPSRAGILTGCYQQRLGGYDNEDITEKGITPEYPLLSVLFKKNGYQTAMIGKWHIGRHDERLKKGHNKESGYNSSCAPGQSPLDHGFNYYFGYNNAASSYYEANDLWEGWDRVPRRPKGEFLTELFNEKAATFIEKSLRNDQPFFVYYAPMTLHGRIDEAPEKYTSKFNTGVKFANNYAGHLLSLDEGIEYIYSILEKYGQIDNTIFVIASDNGAPYIVPPYNAPFKGGKGTGWLGGSHVPLIIVWPGHTKHSMVNDLVSTFDILPTVLDFAGIKVPSNIDGKSLKPLLTGETVKGPHDMLFSSGLHSTRWSYSYIGEKNKKDSKECPLYGWALTDKSVLLMITKTPAGLYKTKPEGLPEIVQLNDWKTDPKQSLNLAGEKIADLKFLSFNFNTWLKKMQEPVLNHQNDFRELLKLSATYSK